MYVRVINPLSDRVGAIGKVIDRNQDKEQFVVNFGGDYYFFRRTDVCELPEQQEGIILTVPLARLSEEITVQQLRDKLGLIGLNVCQSADTVRIRLKA